MSVARQLCGHGCSDITGVANGHQAEPPRDPFLAASHLVDAIVRSVRAPRALLGEPVDPAQSAVLEALAQLGPGM